MKTMKKTIVALSLIVTVLIGSASTCFAAVCPSAPDGVHHFNTISVFAGSEDHYNHYYLYGYDENNEPIYLICGVTITTTAWHYVCQFCGTQKPGDPVHESTVITHSANHNQE